MEKIKNILITTVSTWSLSIILLYTIELTPDVLSVLVTIIICLILFYNMYTTAFTLFTGLCIALQIINDMQMNSDYILYKYIDNISRNNIDYLSGQIPLNQTVTLTITIVMTISVAIIASLTLMRKKISISIVFIILSFCIILMTIIFGKNIPVYYYIIWLLSELMLLWRYMANESYSWKMIPVCVSCMIIAFVIPNVNFQSFTSQISSVIDVPMKWIDDGIYAITGPRYFALNQYGYNNELGGDIDLPEDPVMTVKTVLPIYLAGAKYDMYTGSSWKSSGNEYIWLPDGYEADSVEFLERIASNILMSQATGEFESFAELLSVSENGYKTALLMPMKAYNKVSTEVTILDRTFVLHTPPMTTDISNDKYELNDTGHIISDKLLTENTKYTITYRKNGTISYWDYIIRSSYRGALNDIFTKVKKLHEEYNFSIEQEAIMLVDGPEPNMNLHYLFTYPENEMPYKEGEAIPYETLLEDVLIPYTEKVYEHYTQLPEVYPERIKALTEDIVAEAANDYDKASLIARYLKQFPYTLTPGDPDSNLDFVDQFLFGGQQGYCQYFASAYVIMCRTIGLPARYAEGFYTTGKRTDGVYTVTKKQAHAWAEVYFEGYGWETFDPTPSAEGWTPSRGYLGEILAAHLAGKYDDLGSDYKPVETTPEIIIAADSDTSYVPKQFGLFIIIPFILLILIKLLSRLTYRIRYMMMSPEKSVIWSIKHLRRLLNKNISKSSYKTIRQEFDSISIKLPEVSEIIILYEKCKYSNYIPTREDKIQAWKIINIRSAKQWKTMTVNP